MPRGSLPVNPLVPAGRTAWRGHCCPRKPRSGERMQLAAQPWVRRTAPSKPRRGERNLPRSEDAPRKAQPYNPLAPERIAEILQRLDQLYPDVTCALTHSSAWELLVATILSAQSTDVNVNRVTPELFRKYPTVEAFAALTPEQLEPDVRSHRLFPQQIEVGGGRGEENCR